ncbi:MAG: hypothetical protein EA409_01275 [Saprospirales bacterium]|nr:MAG: hypothetical protein EA409_01275 [Saprospirales bacterium]
MKKVLCFLLSGMVMASSCQNKSFGQAGKVSEIRVEAILSGLDIFHNIYVIDSDNRFVKYSKDGVKQQFYSNHRLGAPSAFDLSNPHKIAVFYPDFQTVVFLDRNLTYTSSQDLSELNLPESRAIGMTNDNNLWVFDEFESVLKRIIPGGGIETVSENSWSLWGKNIRPTHLVERFNRVYLSDPEKGIFIFTNLGSPVDFIERKGIVQTEPVSRDLIITTMKDSSPEYYSFRTAAFLPMQFQMGTEAEEIIQISQREGFFLVRTSNKVSLHSN